MLYSPSIDGDYINMEMVEYLRKHKHTNTDDENINTDMEEEEDEEDDNFIELPLRKAKKSRFPPGCRVLAYRPADSNHDAETVYGKVQAVGINYGSRLREHLYKVWMKERPFNVGNLLTTKEMDLQYAPFTPVWLHVDIIDRGADQKKMTRGIILSSEHSNEFGCGRVSYRVLLFDNDLPAATATSTCRDVMQRNLSFRHDNISRYDSISRSTSNAFSRSISRCDNIIHSDSIARISATSSSKQRPTNPVKGEDAGEETTSVHRDVKKEDTTICCTVHQPRNRRQNPSHEAAPSVHKDVSLFPTGVSQDQRQHLGQLHQQWQITRPATQEVAVAVTDAVPSIAPPPPIQSSTVCVTPHHLNRCHLQQQQRRRRQSIHPVKQEDTAPMPDVVCSNAPPSPIPSSTIGVTTHQQQDEQAQAQPSAPVNQECNATIADIAPPSPIHSSTVCVTPHHRNHCHLQQQQQQQQPINPVKQEGLAMMASSTSCVTVTPHAYRPEQFSLASPGRTSQALPTILQQPMSDAGAAGDPLLQVEEGELDEGEIATHDRPAPPEVELVATDGPSLQGEEGEVEEGEIGTHDGPTNISSPPEVKFGATNDPLLQVEDGEVEEDEIITTESPQNDPSFPKAKLVATDDPSLQVAQLKKVVKKHTTTKAFNMLPGEVLVKQHSWGEEPSFTHGPNGNDRKGAAEFISLFAKAKRNKVGGLIFVWPSTSYFDLIHHSPDSEWKRDLMKHAPDVECSLCVKKDNELAKRSLRMTKDNALVKVSHGTSERQHFYVKCPHSHWEFAHSHADQLIKYISMNMFQAQMLPNMDTKSDVLCHENPHKARGCFLFLCLLIQGRLHVSYAKQMVLNWLQKYKEINDGSVATKDLAKDIMWKDEEDTKKVSWNEKTKAWIPLHFMQICSIKGRIFLVVIGKNAWFALIEYDLDDVKEGRVKYCWFIRDGLSAAADKAGAMATTSPTGTARANPTATIAMTLDNKCFRGATILPKVDATTTVLKMVRSWPMHM